MVFINIKLKNIQNDNIVNVMVKNDNIEAKPISLMSLKEKIRYYFALVRMTQKLIKQMRKYNKEKFELLEIETDDPNITFQLKKQLEGEGFEIEIGEINN